MDFWTFSVNNCMCRGRDYSESQEFILALRTCSSESSGVVFLNLSNDALVLCVQGPWKRTEKRNDFWIKVLCYEYP